jgi:hypothetical protein
VAFATNQLLKLSIQYLPTIATKLVITTLIAILPLPVKAVTLVTSRAAFGSNDGIDWSSLGKVAIGNPGPLIINFDQPVFGVGTQIAVDDILEFNVFVSAFDSANNLFGTFSVPGTSSVTLDNSALFVGISSETANISRLVFSTSELNKALVINKVSIIAFPEPNYTLAILAFGVSSAILKVRQRR